MISLVLILIIENCTLINLYYDLKKFVSIIGYKTLVLYLTTII